MILFSDVGNSDGSTAKEVLSVLFKGVPYEELVNAFQFLDPTTKLIPEQKLSPETATYWRNLATYLHAESEVSLKRMLINLTQKYPLKNSHNKM